VKLIGIWLDFRTKNEAQEVEDAEKHGQKYGAICVYSLIHVHQKSSEVYF